MPGRKKGSKKCDQCGWIHHPDDACKAPKPAKTDEPQQAVHAVVDGEHLADVPKAAVPATVGMTRAAVDARMMMNRIDYLEARMAFLERRLDQLEVLKQA